MRFFSSEGGVSSQHSHSHENVTMQELIQALTTCGSQYKYKHFPVHLLIHILIYLLVFSVRMTSHSSMFSLFKDSDDFKTLLLTVTQIFGSAHRIIVRDKVNRPSASCSKGRGDESVCYSFMFSSFYGVFLPALVFFTRFSTFLFWCCSILYLILPFQVFPSFFSSF